MSAATPHGRATRRPATLWRCAARTPHYATRCAMPRCATQHCNACLLFVGFVCRQGRGLPAGPYLGQTASNTKVGCARMCLMTAGCLTFDFTSASQDNACRMYASNVVPSLGDNDEDRLYCVPGLSLTPLGCMVAAPRTPHFPTANTLFEATRQCNTSAATRHGATCCCCCCHFPYIPTRCSRPWIPTAYRSTTGEQKTCHYWYGRC